jgi:hypothetical protein
VYNNYGTFTMEGGEISGNTASSSYGYSYGGGVFNSYGVYSYGVFTKTSGVIYGDTDTTHTAGSKENTATSGNGHAVFSEVDDVIKKRNSTAGTDVNLDSGTETNWE